MKKSFIIILHMVFFRAEAYVTLGTDENCDYNVNNINLQQVIINGDSEIRVTNQATIYDSLAITGSLFVRGGFNNCTDADNFIISNTKTVIDANQAGPVFAINSPNDGSNQYILLQNLKIKGGVDQSFHNGGGISVYDFNDNFIQITIEDSVISNNSGTRGGGIFLKGDDITMNLFNTIVINNEVLGQAGGSALGGGVYCHSGEFNLNRNSGIYGNHAYSSVQNAGHGGGLYATSRCDVTVTAGTAGGLLDFRGISNNTASSHGGGVYLSAGAQMNIDSSVYQNPININRNVADSNNDGYGDGGGIYLAGNSSNFQGNGLKLEDNDAVHGGGAVIASDALMSINFRTNCWDMAQCNLIKDNRASDEDGKGGAFYLDSGNLYLIHGFVTGNKADQGLILYAQNQSHPTIGRSIIYKNGGNDFDDWADETVYQMVDSDIILSNVTSADNHAKAATIRQTNGAHYIKDSIFYETETNQFGNLINSTGVKDCLLVDNNYGIGSGVSNTVIGNPSFVDANIDNYHLQDHSLAIDMCIGDEALMPVVVDIDGQAIPYDHPDVFNGGTVYDAGADEFLPSGVIFSNGFEATN